MSCCFGDSIDCFPCVQQLSRVELRQASSWLCQKHFTFQLSTIESTRSSRLQTPRSCLLPSSAPTTSNRLAVGASRRKKTVHHGNQSPRAASTSNFPSAVSTRFLFVFLTLSGACFDKLSAAAKSCHARNLALGLRLRRGVRFSRSPPASSRWHLSRSAFLFVCICRGVGGRTRFSGAGAGGRLPLLSVSALGVNFLRLGTGKAFSKCSRCCCLCSCVCSYCW